MTLDARKHTTIAAGEKPTRAALAASILSPNDVIPVANQTEQGQVATAVAAAGITLASAPMVSIRADAPGLHRIEYSFNGTTWIPSSSVLHFANDTARDSWTTTNSALLTVGDTCYSNNLEYSWSGSVWYPMDWVAYTPTVAGITLGTGGTTTAFYQVLGHTVNVRIRTVLGTSGLLTAQATYTLPLTASDGNIEYLDGGVQLNDATGSEYPGIARKQSSTVVAPYCILASNAYSQFDNVNATKPMTWAVNDILVMNFSYRCA